MDILKLAIYFEKLAQLEEAKEYNIRDELNKYRNAFDAAINTVVQAVSDDIWNKTEKPIGYYKIDVIFTATVNKDRSVNARLGFMPAPSLKALLSCKDNTGCKPIQESLALAAACKQKLGGTWSKKISAGLKGKFAPGTLTINAPSGEANNTWFVVETPE